MKKKNSHDKILKEKSKEQYLNTISKSCDIYIYRGGARNFCLGGPICVVNLLVYTNFYIHTQTHVSIHTHTKN